MILLFFAPALLVFPAFIYLTGKYNEFTLSGLIEYPYNPVAELIRAFFKTCQLTFPFIIALLSAQFFLNEKKNEGFRLFETIPASSFTLLKLRYCILLVMVTLSVLLIYFIFLCGIRFFELFFPLLAFGQYDMRIVLALFFSRILFAACCIAIIQYGLHLITNNYYLPIIFAFIAIIFGFLPGTGDFDYYYAGGYLENSMKEVYAYGTTYQWGHAPLMLLPPAIITLLCFLVPSFRKKLISMVR